jgi:DNA-binding transcriptional MerR regulator
MSTYTIGEAAERTGFSTSALRYYEGIGLVVPAARSASGYRLYDDPTLAELAFIARAKQLGCSLGEIADLVEIRGEDGCGPVQQRFHHLVTDKITAARRQIDELTAFVRQLEEAAGHLTEPPADGACASDCACVSTQGRSDPPLVCTLEADARPDRLADWRTVAGHATTRTTTSDGGVVLELDEHIDLAALAALVAAEQQCCAFFSFTIRVAPAGVALEVSAPEGAAGLVDQLFGR